MDIKVFLVSERSGRNDRFFLYWFIMHLPNIYMQLRYSTGLSGDLSLHMTFFKIYTRMGSRNIYMLYLRNKKALLKQLIHKKLRIEVYLVIWHFANRLIKFFQSEK
jgi:hypothetical protein